MKNWYVDAKSSSIRTLRRIPGVNKDIIKTIDRRTHREYWVRLGNWDVMDMGKEPAEVAAKAYYRNLPRIDGVKYTIGKYEL